MRLIQTGRTTHRLGKWTSGVSGGLLSCRQEYPSSHFEFAGWWFGTMEFMTVHSVGNNSPNWRTHIFQRGRSTTNQFGFDLSINQSHAENVWVWRVRCQVWCWWRNSLVSQWPPQMSFMVSCPSWVQGGPESGDKKNMQWMAVFWTGNTTMVLKELVTVTLCYTVFVFCPDDLHFS